MDNNRCFYVLHKNACLFLERMVFMSKSAKKTKCYSGVKCRVKWFNQFKGYGFVEMEDRPGDVFLHFSVLDQAGIKKLNNDDIIICDIDEAEFVKLLNLINTKFPTENLKKLKPS